MCARAMVVGLLTSCQKDADLYAIDAQIAENSILKDAGADSRIARRLQNGTLNLRLHGYAEQQRKCHQTEGKCFVFHNDC